MKATSFRLPDSTVQQLTTLMKQLDMTRTQVLIVALDRLHREVVRKKPAGAAPSRRGGKG